MPALVLFKNNSAPETAEARETKKQINQIERSIKKLESEREKILGVFESGGLAPGEIVEWSEKLSVVKGEIDSLEEKWMELVD